MTEKRFYTDGQYVMQDGEVYVVCGGEHSADVVATALNELLDKNEELKEERDYFERKKCEYHNKWNLAHLDNINLRKENEELRQDNDIKFWKLQCMRQHNSTQVILHELSIAIKQGYEVSDEFKKYTDDLEENNKKMIEKNKRLFGDSE